MKIPLTNDDGFNAKGITLLFNLLSKNHEVTIVAPLRHMSGGSSSISLGKKIILKEENKNIYSVDGTPVDCVKIALGVLELKPDLVISGCNDGENLGRCVNYSGTVGAALESTYFGYKTMAVSTYRDNFDIVEEEFINVFDFVIKENLLNENYSLNINFPQDKMHKGIKIVNLLKEKPKNYFVEVEKNVFTTGPYLLEDYHIKDTDIYETEQGYITISKLKPIGYY